MEHKTTFKDETREWWHNNKTTIKTGAKWLCTGLLVGYIKGIRENRMNNNTTTVYLDRDLKGPKE